MARVGTAKRPAVLRVQSQERATELMQICDDEGIHFVVGVEPEEPEDIRDLDVARNPPEPLRAAPKVGRNEPCPCGSGLKFKKCHA